MSKEDSPQVSRREFLAATGAAITGISGCMGEDSSDSNGTSAQGAETPSNAGTDTPGNNNQRNAPTVQHDGPNELQELMYKEVDGSTGDFAFTVDSEYIDASELEPTETSEEYGEEPTLEHAFFNALSNDDGDYEVVPEEILVVMQDPEYYSGLADTTLDLFDGNETSYGKESGFDPSRESQVDALEHIDGEGVLHSSDLPEYVEQVLTGQ